MKYFYVYIVTLLFCLNASCTKNSDKEYELTLSVYPANSGEVTGAGTIIRSSKVQIKATPNEGFTFKHWKSKNTGQVLAQEPIFLLEVNENIDLIAVFEKEFSNLLIAPFEQNEMEVIPNYGNNVPKDKLLLLTRYIGDDFVNNGISRDNSGVVNDKGNVHMVINTKDLAERGLYRNIVGGGPHMWMSKTFGRKIFPWSKEGQYLRFKIDASVPFVRLEDPNGNISNTNFSASKAPVTQLCFGFYLHDSQSNNTFAYIIALYESRGTYKETANANDTFVNFVSTPVETNSKFITVPSSSTVLQSVPFSEEKTFEVYIKKENLENVIKASNAPLSSDLSRYELTMAGLMFELPNYVLNGHNTSEVMVSNFEVSIEKE